MQKEQHLTDVVLYTGEKEIHCHRTVMAAASLFFKKMFTSGMKESREGEVHLQEIDFNALSLIVRASYGEKLKLNGDNVQSIFEASDRLEMTEYVHDCINYLCNHMDSDNCLDL
ncbi:hypothetical protein CAPTEDRAFT_126136, partial [Capitella teleta]